MRLTLRAGVRLAGVASIVVLAGCIPSGHLTDQRASTPVFDPIAFFAGQTQGRGDLKVLTKRRRTILVEGHGVVGADGSIVLDQDVRQGDGPVKHRRWNLRRIAPGRFAGTLTDAVGPVVADVTGNALHVRFTMKGGLRVQQWLYLQPGGQISRNRMVVTKFGVAVASLDETITRIPE